jgi:hypothetical protein
MSSGARIVRCSQGLKSLRTHESRTDASWVAKTEKTRWNQPQIPSAAICGGIQNGSEQVLIRKARDVSLIHQRTTG